MTKAISVPMLTISSSFRIGVMAATTAMMPPVSMVEMCGVRNRSMDGGEDGRRQQPVAGHGQEDARLAEEGDEQHAGHAGQGADGDQRRGAEQQGVVRSRPLTVKALDTAASGLIL